MQNENLGWLIRDSSNVVRGPYSRQEIYQLIKKGQLKGKTEISRANSYWFALDEKNEVAKFFPEFGGQPADETRMTGTLTQADVSGEEARGVEITQFTAAPSRSELLKGEKAPEVPKSSGGETKIEWLSDEFAAEFGSGSLELENSKKTSATPPASGVDHDTPTGKVEKNELMERATVKADTLPSELKSAKGERPKPINALMKGPETRSQILQQQNIVNVPIKEPEGPGKIISAEEETLALEAQQSKSRRFTFFAVSVALLAVAAFGGYKFVTASKEEKRASQEKKKPIGDPEESLKRSLTLFDLEGAKEALAELELERKGQPFVSMAQAMMKKEFLFDIDGALMSLQTARSLAKDSKLTAEIDNLIGSYSYERDPNGSIALLRTVADENPSQSVFRLNYSHALLRGGKYAEATAVLTSLQAATRNDEEIQRDASLLLGWSRDLASKGSDAGAEAAFHKALDLDPASPRARLGLAIFHLRKFGLREADADFRQFIDLAPELEAPTRVVNFRKMSSFELYTMARREIRELNAPGGAVGSKPSPLIMAVDAILSSVQSRTGEASKILEVALTHAPGDANILKAVAYVRYKDGRFDDVIDILSGLTKEKNSYAVNLMLAKSYAKTGKKSLAEKHITALSSHPLTKGEGWSALGELYYSQGNKAEAKRAFKMAIGRDPEDLVALKGLYRLGEMKDVSDELASHLPF